MATWDGAQTAPDNTKELKTDGLKLYYVNGLTHRHVYEYEPVGGQVQIYTSTYSGADAQLQVFQGKLYCARTLASDTIAILQWDGSSWTQVWSATGLTGAVVRSFMGDENALILAYDYNALANVDMVYSADGVTWSTSITWDAGGMTRTGYWIVSPKNSIERPGTQEGPNIFAQFATASGQPEYIYKFVSGQWQRQSATDFSAYTLWAVNSDAWWRKTDATGVYQYSYQDWATWSTPAANYEPEQCYNLDRTFAGRYNSSSGWLEIYQWDTDANAWVADDTGVALSNGALYEVARLNNDDVFALVNAAVSGGGAREVFQRDPDITGDDYQRGQAPAGGAEFWRDTNGPGAAKVSDLPFDGITNPDCLLSRRSGDVVAASSAAGEIARATSADDYATWTDITGSFPVGSPVKALKEI